MAGPFKLLPLLLLPLFTFSVYAHLIASIDCGASENTTDTNGIVWTSDDKLISKGDTREVQSNYAISRVMDTLRVFTTQKKSCYSTSVTKGDKLLVRASFNYGNYDQRSAPPSFDLHFDGNFWTTVQTSLDRRVTWYEAIFVAKRDTVSVCVAQTYADQFPFISALEVRRLESDFYNRVDDNRALFLIYRIAFGASGTIRFPSDPFDRMWLPSGTLTGTIKETNAIFVNATALDDNPPSEIFQNALRSLSPNFILFVASPRDAPLYSNMYFTEVSSLGFGDKRWFRVHFSDGSALPGVITPVLGVGAEIWFKTVTNISLIATVDSNLQPLISAMETFTISKVLTDGTHNDDVEALALLQSTFDVLRQWNGDPCLPAPYSWDWLNCSDDPTPRVTALYLAKFSLSGSLPDIKAMHALTIIDLHDNSLTGPIPSFLGDLPNLQQLNLANNRFSGDIPTSLSENNKLTLNVAGNPSLCASGDSCSTSLVGSSSDSTDSEGSKKKNKLPMIIGITIVAFILVLVVAGVFIILRRRARPANAKMPVVTGTSVGAHQTTLMATGTSVGAHQTMLTAEE